MTLSDNGPEQRERPAWNADVFAHEAALYPGVDAFLDVTVPFIREALDAQEPILVAVDSKKIEMLRRALGADGERVRFADIDVIGSNPGRIIPAWLRFVDDRPTPETRMWGIGEPIGPDRSERALVECQRHESLLNVAFADTPLFNLLCPYDTEALDAAVIEEAHCSHPLILRDGALAESETCRSLTDAGAPCTVPLTPPPDRAAELAFEGSGALPVVRRFVEQQARAAGLQELGDLTLVVNELVVNSLVHGGGKGVLRIWAEEEAIVCEVSDHGRIDSPLAGRRPPTPGQYGGWGLWLANQLCELVQLRSFERGSTARVYLSRNPG